MDNAKDPGPSKKPNRPQARTGSTNRKPQPVKKPSGARPTAAKPVVNRPRTPAKAPAVTAATETQPIDDARQPMVDDVAVEQAEVVQADPAPDTVEAQAEPANDIPEPADEAIEPEKPPVSRLNVARLNLPRLTLPNFSGARGKADDVDEVASHVPDEVSDEPSVAPEPSAEPEPSVNADPQIETAIDSTNEPFEDPTPEPQPSDQRTPKTAAIPVVQTKTGQPKTGAIAVVPPKGGSTAVAKTTGTAVAPKKVASRGGSDLVLLVEGLTKRFDDKVAVNAINLEVHVGAFYGIVGPNGAGKTTTLSMITGLLRPDAGSIAVHGADVWSDPVVAKRNMGVLPDRLRLFDRLTGAQVLYYAGVLRGLDAVTVRKRTADLAGAFGLEEALGRLVTDYSAGMTKKIALAAAMIHSPRLLVLDEPFESVDPVSSATITEILKNYAEAGGTVVLSSHSMDLVQRICDHVAVIVGGDLLADGTMSAVRDGSTLEERFVELAGGRKTVEGLEWLHSFSD